MGKKRTFENNLFKKKKFHQNVFKNNFTFSSIYISQFWDNAEIFPGLVFGIID